MEVYDLSKLDIAIQYTERIAEGKNPVTNQTALQGDAMNNPNVTRCMYFIRDVLRSVRKNGGTVGSRNSSGRMPFPLGEVQPFEYEQDVTISRIAKQMNRGVDKNIYKTFSAQMIIRWLESQGFVNTHPDGSDKRHTLPTEEGREIGIRTEMREYNGNAYEAVVYGEGAQKLIFSHAEEILAQKEN